MGIVVQAVHRLFSRHLLLTNTVSCITLMGLGDVAVQRVENWAEGHKRPNNWARTGIYDLELPDSYMNIHTSHSAH